MIGLIHHSLKVMVLELFGLELWETVLRENNIDIDIEFVALEYYPDGPLVALVVSLSKNLGVSIDDCLYKFGVWIIPYLIENGYKEHISCLGGNLKDFLNNVNSHHIFINQYSFKSKLIFPQFMCESNTDGTLTLHYFSRRQGLGAFMKGIVEICAEILFGLKIEMTVLQINNETNLNQTYQHYIYNVKSLDKLPLFVAPNSKKVVLQVPKEHAEVVTMKDFCLMSPTHICFDKKMLIEHCGEFLQKELGFSSKHPTHLATLFEIIQPDYESMNFKNITKNINAPYMFRLKKNMKRNHKETCDKLLLIGQMYLINNGESLLFINSPYITTAMELKKTNMYISDFSKSDTTRDLIFLNQSRLYRNNANSKLEESMKLKTELTIKLDIKKAQAMNLSLEFLPMSIIEKKKIDNANDFAEEFKDVTCMIAILTCFDLIYQNCSVKDVTEILDKVYQSFDRLIELHQCQKVARSIDAYHVVSGMPVKINDHAARILNLAIGFVYESQQVIVPKLNLPVVIRIAIHTGTVSAGLVGEAKFRYCVFGEGFDVPKRLLEMDGVQDQIIVTNATKQSVSKSSWDSFDFTNLGYKQVRKNHATCTYRLNKNEKKTIWDIIQQPKEEGKSQDGYDKLNQNHIKSWSKIDRQQQLQKISISLMKKNSLPSNFLYHTRGRKFNKTWKRATTISQDSGFSIESNRSLDSVDSIACLIM